MPSTRPRSYLHIVRGIAYWGCTELCMQPNHARCYVYLKNHFASCTPQAVWVFRAQLFPARWGRSWTARPSHVMHERGRGGPKLPDFVPPQGGARETPPTATRPRPRAALLLFPRCLISKYGGKNEVCQATYWLLQVQKGNRGSG